MFVISCEEFVYFLDIWALCSVIFNKWILKTITNAMNLILTGFHTYVTLFWDELSKYLYYRYLLSLGWYKVTIEEQRIRTELLRNGLQIKLPNHF